MCIRDRCGICHTRKRVVSACGDLNSKIWVITDKPSHAEEMLNYPLSQSGYAGKILRNHLLPLAEIEWTKEVRFDHINKCRPPNDRDAKQTERDECFDYLIADIVEHKPELIITLGVVPFTQFFPEMKKSKASLKKYHGKSLKWEYEDFTCEVIPMYHPAVVGVTKNSELGEILDGDFKRIKYKNRKSGSETRGVRSSRYKSVSGIRASEILQGESIFAFDYETTDPNWNGTFQARRAREIGFSIGTGSGAVYCHESSTYIKEFLEDNEVAVIAHNAKFEYIVGKNCGINITNLHDTKLMAYVLRKPSTELKDLVWNELGIAMTRFEQVDWDDEDQVTQYGASDSDMTYRLFYVLKKQLEDQDMWSIYQDIELPLLTVLARMEMNGVAIDTDPLEELKGVLADEEADLSIDIKSLYPYKINWRSVQQKLNALYGADKWKIRQTKEHQGRLLHIPQCDRKLKISECSCMVSDSWVTFGEKIKTGSRIEFEIIPPGLDLPRNGLSTDMESLRKLRDATHHPICDLLIKQNSINRLFSSELEYMPKLIQEDGRIHCSYHQAGSWEETGGDWKEATETGRLSSSGPNLQNVTHHGDPERPYIREWATYVRKAFSNKRPGMVLVKADIGQEEPRIASVLGNDRALQHALESSDVYKPLASIAFGKPPSAINGEERQVGKAIFLEWLYEGRDFTAKAPWLSQTQRDEILHYQSSQYSGYMQYRLKQIDHLKHTGYTETWFGRRRTFPAYRVSRGWQKAELERKALNHPIQGTGADVLKLAMTKVQKEIDAREWHTWKVFGPPQHDPRPKLVLNVHDEIVVECHEHSVERVIRICQRMTDDILPITLPVEVSWGKSWEEQEEV